MNYLPRAHPEVKESHVQEVPKITGLILCSII